MSPSLSERYPDVRSALIGQLRDTPALTGLQLDESADWIIALCDAWAALAEVVGFYQDRIIEEAFLATARQSSSLDLLYRSLGHSFPPNATATTALAYQLSPAVAGVEAVTRARSSGAAGTSPEERSRLAAPPGPVPAPDGAGTTGGGASGSAGGSAGSAGGPPAPGGTPSDSSGLTSGAGPSATGLPMVGAPAGIATAGGEPSTPATAVGAASQVPAAAQVRAIPTGAGSPPVFATLAPLGAYVGASQLPVAVSPATPPPRLSAVTTQLELADTKTGLAVGQAIVVAASTPDGGQSRWPRVLTKVAPDAKRGSTRIAWQDPLGSLLGEEPPASSASALVYGFASSSRLVAATAPDWSSLTAALQLAVQTEDGAPIPVRGGFAHSSDAGATWTLDPAGLPAGSDLAAIGAYDGVTIVSAGQSLLRSASGAPFGPTALAGGARRAVGFLGGAGARMLAGAAGGVVYESLDGGRTWTAVTGGAPVLVSAGAASSQSAAAAGRTVQTNQLPSTSVRCVIEDPEDPSSLLAGTDAGLYVYQAGNWGPALDANGNPTMTMPVFALVATNTVTAATALGVLMRSGGSWAPPAAGALTLATYALAQADGALYALTSAGVWTDAEATWQNANGTGTGALPPAAGATTILALTGTVLVAGTGGIYRSTGKTPDLVWERCDHAVAFTIPRAAFEPPAPGPAAAPPAGLVAALSVFGLELTPGARLSAAGTGCLLTDDGHSYELVPVAGSWQVTLLDALPDVTALALAPDGTIVAAGAAPTTIANQWPGFAVAGSQLEIEPPVRNIAPQTPALIEQRTPQPRSLVIDVTAVEQDTALRAGRQTALTRIAFSQELTAGDFPRRASTVWTGSTSLSLFDPPASSVTEVSGTTVTLASELAAPVESGRLGTVTGAPPGLAVAPLGGAIRIPEPGAPPQNVGPPQADVLAAAVGGDGSIYLGTGEGVFVSDPRGATLTLIGAGWPGEDCTGLAVGGGTLMAAGHTGVRVLIPGTGGAPDSWETAGLDSPGVTALAWDGSTAVACCADGSARLARDVSDLAFNWTALAPLATPPTAVTIDGSAVYVATSTGVASLDVSGTASAAAPAWTMLDQGWQPGTVTCLQAHAGTLWAGSSQGLQSFSPTSREWRPDPAVAGSVLALAVTPAGNLLAAGPSGVLQSTGAGWGTIAGTAGVSVAAMAAAPDGSLWLAARAALPLATAPGTAAQQLSHEIVLAGVSVQAGDLDTLAQGAVPDVLLSAFADAGTPLDPSYSVVTADGQGCWIIRCPPQLYVVTERVSGPAPSLNVYRNQAILYPTGAPTATAATQTWPVEVGGIAATLTAQTARILHLPAGSDAPALTEPVNVASVSAAEATPAIVGAGTQLTLQQPLAHVYDASTVKVNLNVVAAAQGQPVSLPIGSGDPTAAHQTLAVPTAIAAIGATPADQSASNPASTLQIYVDGQPWTEVKSLPGSAPGDTVYIMQSNSDGSATVTFGDGANGARLPAGRDNVVATYLQGGGTDGEVAQGALIQPLNRPPLVTGVLNPLAALVPATPQAAESRLAAVRRLDRTVSLDDYKDLARAQAGVATASAELVTGAPGQAVVVSVAATSDAPLDLLDRVSAAIGPVSASGLPVRVVDAVQIPVVLALRVVSASPKTADSVSAALAGFSSAAPGSPFLATQVLYAATAVSGVAAATILGWARAGQRTSTRTSLPAARASWRHSQPEPSGAELPLIDATRLTISVIAPADIELT